MGYNVNLTDKVFKVNERSISPVFQLYIFFKTSQTLLLGGDDKPTFPLYPEYSI
jgi:hypothetical protein